MTEIVSNSASIESLIKRIGWYKGSPTRIVQATYDFFDDVMNQKVDLVDANSPFIMLIESSAVHTAIATNETLLNIRRSNVALAQTDSDIYRHLTDDEYIGRFAWPSSAKFMFMIQLNSLANVMVFDADEDCWKAIIPRDSVYTVDNLTFTQEYPIVIRRYPTGGYQVSYDLTYDAPLGRPSNNLIQSFGRQDPGGVKWMYFTIPIKQMKVVSTTLSIQKNAVFRKDLPFENQFIHARVFNKSAATNDEWKELRTTHSEQVFDPSTPTAILMVTTGNLNVTIPYIYNTRDLVSGQIRVDIYSTRGDSSVNLSTYSLDAFSTQLRSIDEKRDASLFTNVWSQVSYIAFSEDISTGGKNGLPFEELKQKTINYSVGNNQIPITTAKLDTLSELLGFDIVRNTDALTERFFFGTRPLPEVAITDAETKTQRLISRSNVGMIRFSSDLVTLLSSDNVANNEPRLTLLSNSTFSLNNGISTLVELSTVNGIKSQPVNELVSTVNAAQYVYTPYYYVFDPKDTILDVRPYDLDNPSVTDLSFVRQNQSLAMPVNTGSGYAVEKTPAGYRLTIITTSGQFYKDANDNNVSVQLRFINTEETLAGTINGILIGRDEETNERIYQFDIETNYDINSDHHLCVTNAYNGVYQLPNFFVSLDTKIDVLYCTNAVSVDFTPDQTDALINKQTLPSGTVGNSHDQITFHFGQFLDHLWARVRTYASGPIYKTSPVDVPALYETDVYEINPVTNSTIFFDVDGNVVRNKIHNQGDPVMDGANPVYKYRTGDVIHDSNGDPIPLSSIGSKNEFDIFVMDGKLLFTTDQIYVSYRQKIIQMITGWITNDLLEIQNRLIERTKIFFYPQTTLGLTKIILDDGQTAQINSEQSPSITLYVDDTVINDLSVQENIEAAIISHLDARIRDPKYTINTIEQELKDLAGKTVSGVSIWGIGGDQDYQQIRVSEEHNRLALKKRLVVQSDNSITINVDVEISFRPN